MQKPMFYAILTTILLICSFQKIAFAGETASAPTKAKVQAVPRSIVPADIKTEINRALADPIISAEFLVQVYKDQATQKFLVKYNTLRIECNEAWSITFHREPMSAVEPSAIVISMVGLRDIRQESTAFVNLATRKLNCEGSSDQAKICENTQAFFAGQKQSKFFRDMKRSVSEAAGIEQTQTARK